MQHLLVTFTPNCRNWFFIYFRNTICQLPRTCMKTVTKLSHSIMFPLFHSSLSTVWKGLVPDGARVFRVFTWAIFVHSLSLDSSKDRLQRFRSWYPFIADSRAKLWNYLPPLRHHRHHHHHHHHHRHLQAVNSVVCHQRRVQNYLSRYYRSDGVAGGCMVSKLQDFFGKRGVQ
jgi:hypothetical protein